MDEQRRNLETLLIETWEYPPQQVDRMIERLMGLKGKIGQARDEWLDTGEVPDHPEFREHTPKTLVEAFGFKPPNALLTLDWIRREPVQALSALQEEYGRTH